MLTTETNTSPSTRWSTTLSSKVNLHYAMNFGALWGANLVTQLSKFRNNEPLEVHRVVLSFATSRWGFLLQESGPLNAVHLSRHKWPGGFVN